MGGNCSNVRTAGSGARGISRAVRCRALPAQGGWSTAGGTSSRAPTSANPCPPSHRRQVCNEIRRHLNGVMRMVWILRSLPEDVQRENGAAGGGMGTPGPTLMDDGRPA